MTRSRTSWLTLSYPSLRTPLRRATSPLGDSSLTGEVFDGDGRRRAGPFGGRARRVRSALRFGRQHPPGSGAINADPVQIAGTAQSAPPAEKNVVESTVGSTLPHGPGCLVAPTTASDGPQGSRNGWSACPMRRVQVSSEAVWETRVAGRSPIRSASPSLVAATGRRGLTEPAPGFR